MTLCWRSKGVYNETKRNLRATGALFSSSDYSFAWSCRNTHLQQDDVLRDDRKERKGKEIASLHLDLPAC